VKSSFLKKSSKNFYSIGSLPVLRGFAMDQIDKVFLLLFVHKKKILPFT